MIAQGFQFLPDGGKHGLHHGIAQCIALGFQRGDPLFQFFDLIFGRIHNLFL